MQTVEHPEEGTIPRYSVSHLRHGGAVVYENDENGVVSEVEIAKSDLPEVIGLLGGYTTISYEIHADDLHTRGTVALPSWAEGDPQMAVALYFFGHRSSAHCVTRFDIVNVIKED